MVQVYDPPTSCDLTPKPGMDTLRDWIMGVWDETVPYRADIQNLGIARSCSTAPPWSEHHEYGAFDAGLRADIPEQKRTGDELAGWAVKHAPQTGVQVVIWDAPAWDGDAPCGIWSLPRASEGWRPYDGPSGHTDHAHIGVNDWGRRHITYQLLNSTIREDQRPMRLFRYKKKGQPPSTAVLFGNRAVHRAVRAEEIDSFVKQLGEPEIIPYSRVKFVPLAGPTFGNSQLAKDFPEA